MTFRFEPTAEVNANWHVKARIDASSNPKEDESKSLEVKRVWAQGDYKNFQVKIGKVPLASTETAGMLFDDQYSGAQLTFGNKLKATLEAGRWNLAMVLTNSRQSRKQLILLMTRLTIRASC